MSYYINKSLKGNSIISNLNVENSFITNTSITTEQGSTYDIGSSTNTFKTGYFDNLNVSGQTLGSSSSLTEPPISIADGKIKLNYDTSQFSIDNDNQLSFDYTLPFKFENSGLELNFNTQQFNLSGDKLNHRVGGPFQYNDTQGLSLKVKQGLGFYGINFNKLFVNGAGELDVNISDLIYPSKGIKKIPIASEALDLGLDLGGIDLPDLTVLGIDLDSGVLDFKLNKISIKSQGQSRIPYFNAFTITSDSSFLYNDALNELSVDRILLNDTVDVNSNNNRVASKQYADNLNTYASNSALFYTQASGDSTREWDIRLNDKYLGLDADEKLITKITGAEGKCISVSPDNEILLTFEAKHFADTDGKLISKLSTVTNGCLSLTPDYELELGFDTAQFSIAENKLKSTLTNKTGNCVLISPDNEVYLDYHTNNFEIVDGKLKSKITGGGVILLSETNEITLDYNTNDFEIVSGKLNTKITGSGCIFINDTNEITLDFNTTDFEIMSGKLKSKITASGAILLSSTNVISVDVNTTYLAITSDKITFASEIITKINKIENIETELNTTKGKVTTLEGKVTTAEGNITSIQGKVTTAEGTLTSHTTSLSTHTGQIAALQGQIGGAIGAGVGGGILGAGAGLAGGILGGAGSATAGLGGAAIAGIAGLGGALLGVGIGVLITENENEVDTEGEPTYSYEVTGELNVANATFEDLIVTGNIDSLTQTITGSTSGVVSILVQENAGSFNFNLPITAGTTGQVLTSQGGGSTAMTWSTPTTGTVTSIGLSVPSFLNVSGSPITSNGTLTISYSGTALPISNGGSGSTTATGSGSVVLANTPTLITPNIGVATGTSLNLSGNGSFVSSSAGIPAISLTQNSTTSNDILSILSPNLPNNNLTSVILGRSNTNLNAGLIRWASVAPGNIGNYMAFSIQNGTYNATDNIRLYNNGIYIPLTTASTSITTGALVNDGGLGIGGALYGTTANFTNNNDSVFTVSSGTYTPNQTPAKFLSPALGLGSYATVTQGVAQTANNSFEHRFYRNDAVSSVNNYYALTPLGGSPGFILTAGGLASFPGTTSSSSTTTGALVIGGGIGVAGNGNFAGNISSLSCTIKGSTSGIVSILVQENAGSFNFNLPITAGTTGQVLTSQGGGSTAMTWSTPTTGTCTSVALTVPSFLSISNSPITSNGTLTISYSGTALPISNGGTGSTTATGSGSVVLANSPTLITPVLGVASGMSLSLGNSISALTVGNTSSSTSQTSILVQNSSTGGLVLGVAGGNGQYSANAAIGDSVIRTTGGKLLLGVNGGDSAVTILETSSSFTRGILHINNPNTTPRCLISAFAQNMVAGSSYFFQGKEASTNNSAEIDFNFVGAGNISNSMGIGLYGPIKLTINGSGNVAMPASASVAGNLDVSGTFTRTVNWLALKNSSSPWPNTSWTSVKNWYNFYGVNGLTLTTVSGQFFRNDLGYTVFANVSFTGSRGGIGRSQYRMQTQDGSNFYTWSQITQAGNDVGNLSATVKIPPSAILYIEGYQDSGVGQDFLNCIMTISII